MHSLCTGGAALQSECIVPYRCVCKYSFTCLFTWQKKEGSAMTSMIQFSSMTITEILALIMNLSKNSSRGKRECPSQQQPTNQPTKKQSGSESVEKILYVNCARIKLAYCILITYLERRWTWKAKEQGLPSSRACTFGW